MWFVMEKAQQSYTLSRQLLEAIRSRGSNRHALMGSMSYGRLETLYDGDQEIIERLIDEGADVNQQHGVLLPLHCACMVGDVRALHVLLRNGAKIDALDGYYRSALHHAVERSPACTAVLLHVGASVDVKDTYMNTPLHWASFTNNVECVRLLLENHASVNALNNNNDSPLSFAAIKGNLESVQLLLDYNAEVEIENYNGYTPLHKISYFVASGLNSSEDDMCLELLVRASGQIQLVQEQRRIGNLLLRDNKLCEYLMPFMKTPRRLQDLCRFMIRRCLGQCHLPGAVAQLPIPYRLHKFILLKY